jgi:adenosylcobinamide-GDP ribazoletransferase
VGVAGGAGRESPKPHGSADPHDSADPQPSPPPFRGRGRAGHGSQFGGAAMTDRWPRPITDVALSIAFATRLPLAHLAQVAHGDIARASWAMPAAGAVVGAVAALAYFVAIRLGLPASVAAALAIAAGMALTGAMHEDGLADTADALGGDDRARKLEIMHDSRLGTYGGCALVLSILLRWAALASIGSAGAVALALIAAHTAARATLPAVMAAVPPARSDGLAASFGAPPREAAAVAALIGALALVLCLGLEPGLLAAVLLGVAAVAVARLSLNAIGGHTGDVLGAIEQVGEVLVLLVAVASGARP